MEYSSTGFFNDQEILLNILEIHAVNNPLILDVTYNSGKMWKGLDLEVTKCDINKHFPIDVNCDFLFLPFKPNTFDVIVFDPPHLPNCSDTKTSNKQFVDNYGLNNIGCSYREGKNVSGYFVPFLLQAMPVLTTNGILLCKICDLINCSQYQWQHVDFINAVRDLGYIACDMVIKSRKSKLISGKWKQVKHFRKNHSYWIIVRKGKKCYRP